MIYSGSLYESYGDLLDKAQENSHELICRKLQFNPGEHLLDIGCGWSGLICYAAANCVVIVHGITLSAAQKELCQQKVAQDRLAVPGTVASSHCTPVCLQIFSMTKLLLLRCLSTSAAKR